MSVRTYAWNTATHLQSPADVAAYLEAALEEGADDPAFLLAAIGIAARAHGMSRLADETGITRRGLYKALGSDANPSFATICAVLQALGVRIRAEAAPARARGGRRAGAPRPAPSRAGLKHTDLPRSARAAQGARRR